MCRAKIHIVHSVRLQSRISFLSYCIGHFISAEQIFASFAHEELPLNFSPHHVPILNFDLLHVRGLASATLKFFPFLHADNEETLNIFQLKNVPIQYNGMYIIRKT